MSKDEVVGTFSEEVLTHFCCGDCKQWWTIGSIRFDDKRYYCPRCGALNRFVQAEPLGESDATNITTKL